MNENKEEVLKKECYLFDFAPNRALKKISEYVTRLVPGEDNSEKKIADFIHPDYNDKIGIIKDISAGAVFFSAVFAFVVILIIYLPKIY